MSALVAACAVGPAMFLSAATAHADPDQNAPAPDPQAQCESPQVGGVFTAGLTDEMNRSICQYIVEGYFYYDIYDNGAYTGTTVYRDGAQVPTQRPDIPALLGPIGHIPGLPI